MTGFRVGLRRRPEPYGIRPDLTTLGKVIGGGLPVGAYGGRRDLMEQVAPAGPVYQAGTLSGNPLAMAAGIATLDALASPGFFEELDRRTASLERGLNEVLAQHGNVARADRVGSIFYIWFKAGQSGPARNYEEIRSADSELFGRFFSALLAQGVTIAPSAFEVGFVSAAHQQTHIDATLTAVDRALTAVLAKDGAAAATRPETVG